MDTDMVAHRQFDRRQVTTTRTDNVVITITFGNAAQRRTLFHPHQTGTLVVQHRFFRHVFHRFTMNNRLATRCQRRQYFTIFVVSVGNMVANGDLQQIKLVVARQARAKMNPSSVIATWLLFGIHIVRFRRMVSFALFGLRYFQVAFMFRVNNTSSKGLIRPQSRRRGAFVFILRGMNLLLNVRAQRRGVTTFSRTGTVEQERVRPLIRRLFRPQTNNIGRTTHLPTVFFTNVSVFHFRGPRTIFTTDENNTDPDGRFTTFARRRLNINRCRANIICPAIEVFRSTLGFQFWR